VHQVLLKKKEDAFSFASAGVGAGMVMRSVTGPNGYMETKKKYLFGCVSATCFCCTWRKRIASSWPVRGEVSVGLVFKVTPPL
jgi:hypothetical protein